MYIYIRPMYLCYVFPYLPSAVFRAKAPKQMGLHDFMCTETFLKMVAVLYCLPI